MNQRLGTQGERYRWANGGRMTLARHGRAHFSAIANGGGLRVYGESEGAKSLRASDLARKRTLSPDAWEALMQSREQAFGLPAGTLTKTGKEETADPEMEAARPCGKHRASQ